MTNVILADETGDVIDVFPLPNTPIIELSEDVSEVMLIW